MKKLVTFLTFLMGALAQASSPMPAVVASLEPSLDGPGVRLVLQADQAEAYRVAIRQLVASPTGDLEVVPLPEVGLGAREVRDVATPRVDLSGAPVRRLRYEIEAVGLRTGHRVLQVVDQSFVAEAGGGLRAITDEEARRIAPPSITFTGEPVPADVRAAMGVSDVR